MSKTPALPKSDLAYSRRLAEIRKAREAARARRDWAAVATLDVDYDFVFRQWMGRS